MKFLIVFSLYMVSTLALPQRQQLQRGARQAALDDSQNAQILKYEANINKFVAKFVKF